MSLSNELGWTSTERTDAFADAMTEGDDLVLIEVELRTDGEPRDIDPVSYIDLDPAALPLRLYHCPRCGSDALRIGTFRVCEACGRTSVGRYHALKLAMRAGADARMRGIASAENPLWGPWGEAWARGWRRGLEAIR